MPQRPLAAPARRVGTRVAVGAGSLVLAVLAVAVTLLVAAPSAAAPSARSVLVADTTTTVPDTTTTTTSTTTAPTTTTTTVPSTTTTHPHTTTTTPSTTTTTTTPPASSSSGLSSTEIALIVAAAVLIVLVILVLLLLRRRNRLAAAATWRRGVRPALDDARLARESLLSPNAVSDDPQLRGSVDVQVDRAARALDQAATDAPDEAGQTATNSVSSSLRGLAFAVEADRLLRHGAAAPTGAQLAQADEARRARLAELDGAIARLQAHLGPLPGTGGQQQAG